MPAIEKVLKGVDFDQVMVEQWTDTICESCMQGHVDLQKPFKYVVSSLSVDRGGAGHGRMSSHLGVLGPSETRPICYGCSGERRHAPGRVALRRFHLLPLNWMQSVVAFVVFCLFLNALD